MVMRLSAMPSGASRVRVGTAGERPASAAMTRSASSRYGIRSIGWSWPFLPGAVKSRAQGVGVDVRPAASRPVHGGDHALGIIARPARLAFGALEPVQHAVLL